MSISPFSKQPLSHELLDVLCRIRLTNEKSRYAYLPATAWMQRSGYTEELVGAYKHACRNQPVYRLTMLSQTGMLLLFRDEKYVDAQLVQNDEELMRFLALHGFPLPQ
jgi:hypothetical protein